MLRNFLFSIFFYIGIILISIIFLPAFILPQKFVLFGGKLMGYWTGFCLRTTLGVRIEVLGKENIVNNKIFFIAASHQSMFETFYLQTIFKSPIFILKKELLRIPIFGWYLKKIGSIAIIRDKISKDNLNFFDQIKTKVINSKRPLLIFPQGTRVKPDERPQFKKGASRIYGQLKISCQPVAINSGYVWPKKGPKTPNRNITISILPLINYELEKVNFTKLLEEKIYFELDRIN